MFAAQAPSKLRSDGTLWSTHARNVSCYIGWMHILAVAAVIAVVAYLVWDRSNRLFQIEVTDGHVEVASGQVSPRFVQAVREVVAFPPVARATIRGVKAADGASLRCSGLDDGRIQRLRNVYRLIPQSAFRSGEAPINERNFWKLFNLVWLINLFRR